MPKRKQLLDNSKQPIKDVLWYLDNDVMVAHCPSCEELAYEKNECVFCHQKYRYTPKPNGYEDTVITIGEWEIWQVYGSWGVYIIHKGQIVIHASCSQKLSEEELKRWLEKYANK